MIQKYVEKPKLIDAVKVTFESLPEVLTWTNCNSFSVNYCKDHITAENPQGIMFCFHVDGYVVYADLGWYIFRKGGLDVFLSYSEKDFNERFKTI
jgi:hypothetical protein